MCCSCFCNCCFVCRYLSALVGGGLYVSKRACDFSTGSVDKSVSRPEPQDRELAIRRPIGVDSFTQRRLNVTVDRLQFFQKFAAGFQLQECFASAALVRDERTHPHRPRLVVYHSTCRPLSSSPPREQLCNRSCSNKHTPGERS